MAEASTQEVAEASTAVVAAVSTAEAVGAIGSFHEVTKP
jgi:hypothetical protein